MKTKNSLLYRCITSLSILLLFCTTPIYADSDFWEKTGDKVSEVTSEVKAELSETGNESWMFFSPTALVNQTQHSVELDLWFKDIADADIRISRARYSFQLLNAAQFDVQTNTSDNSGHHSSYVYARYAVLDPSMAPVGIGLGVRGRLFWNDDNKEFDTGEDTDDTNDKRNKLTLFASATGGLSIQQFNLALNAYVDNQAFSAGAKLTVMENIKVFADSIYYYYENATVTSDAAVGVQLYNQYGFVTTVSYQKEADRATLGIAVGF